ncbi:ethanolamine ammonia-lyase subunit EutC [Achromobacter aloeverae]|uniref:Ethanolamine ammonia-lyase small subunit n=1 Tax=Achromobacter aloeverae TaxID=1750518 RepID=A0A4Q1HMS3_9BURK|nr:ethanolamine ammonia-lyase subunit EutC [Achromobacter aloeverae]RXN92282.1 ethanolamine ammonia-lyase [Achromobacter aloeverae]
MTTDDTKDPAADLPDTATTAPLWRRLRELTAARIGLPRTGASLATESLLDFRMSHARARDAVHAALDIDALRADLLPLGLPVLHCRTEAAERERYLLRPDLGRRLDDESRERLLSCGHRGADLCITVADGLSATAGQHHATALLGHLAPLLRRQDWLLGPLVLLEQGRVAAGDDIGEALDVKCMIILVGERPGLTSPDSLGAYMTWMPRVGRTDAERNCVSNIRPRGLPLVDAATKIAYLAGRMRAEGCSGVRLKDEIADDTDI